MQQKQDNSPRFDSAFGPSSTVVGVVGGSGREIIRLLSLSTHRLSRAVAVEEDEVRPPPTVAGGLTEEDAVGAPPGRRGAAFVVAADAAFAFASGLPAAPPPAPPWRPTETASLNLALRSAGESAERARPWWSMAVFSS